MKIRISLVHYLNSAPLGWAFLHGPFRDDFEVIPSSPADCSDQLSRGEADIGLIPSIECQRIPNLQVIPGVSISAQSAVRSILMIRPKGSGERPIGAVAMDVSSRTSVTLAKTLLQVRMKVHPEYVPSPPDPEEMLKRCDTAVIIGDPALKVRLEDYDVLDLAEEWVRWQGKPFVCALWASRSDRRIPPDLASIFQEAKSWGLERRREIALSFARSLELPAQFLEDYLHRNIDYDLGPRHLEGVGSFYRLAFQEGLISGVQPLRFVRGAAQQKNASNSANYPEFG